MGFIDRLSSKLRTSPDAPAASEPAPPASVDREHAPPPSPAATPGDADGHAVDESEYVWKLLASPSGSHLYFLNPDHVQLGLLDMIERAPRVVLDVGCYCGATGETIKRRWPGAKVIGIEPLAEAAALAAPRIDRVITGTLESVDFAQAGLAPGSVDTIILADVLEHIFNPWLALQRLRTLLTDDGVVLASIPNVRNLGLIHNLAAGHWTYQGGGLLDITHIRFFTLAEIRTMFAQTGFAIASVEHNVDPALQQLWDLDAAQGNTTIQFGALTLKDVPPADRRELATVQFYVRAGKSD